MPRSKKLNLNDLLKKYDFKGSKSLQRAAYNAAVKKADKIRKEALSELDQHAVTKEIEAGPNAMGSSLLGGRGSLFGFLGFIVCLSGFTSIKYLLTRPVFSSTFM
jgi:hypothetical protein